MVRPGHGFRRRLACLENCSRGLVTGHYPSLADNPGVAPEPDQTCFQQSDLKTLRRPPSGFRAVLNEDQRSKSDAGRSERPKVGSSSGAVLPYGEQRRTEIGSRHQRAGRRAPPGSAGADLLTSIRLWRLHPAASSEPLQHRPLQCLPSQPWVHRQPCPWLPSGPVRSVRARP